MKRQRTVLGMERFRERLRELRTRREMTQQQVADACGMSKTYVHELECGRRKPSWLVLRRLAEALGDDVDDLACLANCVPDDVRRMICNRPELARLVRRMSLKTNVQMRELLEALR